MRNRYIVAGDVLLVAIAWYCAFALRFDWRAPNYRPEFWPFLGLAVLAKPSIFFFFSLYRRYWQYMSIRDSLALCLGVGTSSLVLLLLVGFAVAGGWVVGGFSRAVVLIDALLTLCLTGGLRLGVRILSESGGSKPKAVGLQRRVLVVGAGDGGTMVVREMQRNLQLGLRPTGFLDDDPAKQGKRICDLPVLGPISALDETALVASADEVIIAMPTAPGRVVRDVVERCRRAGVPSRIIPGVFELLDGRVSVTRLRQVQINDLLRRTPFRGDEDVSRYVASQSVLVTGAGGSIGLELCRQLVRSQPRSLVLLGHGENSLFEAVAELADISGSVPLRLVVADVRDAMRLERVFVEHRPEVVFHAAAHKHVVLMEDNPEEAVSTNVLGTYNVVAAAQRAGTERLVFVSTDKAVFPRSVMGASKRIAEAIVGAAARRHRRAFMTVRFGNVLGSRGSVVQVFKRQIERGGPITVTHPDMTRFFMTIPEAVHLVLQAGAMGRGGEVFVLDMGEPVRIVDLAHDLARLSGHEPGEIEVVFSGVRPGEKLEESLHEPDARVEPTVHPAVLRAVEREHGTPEDLDRLVPALAAAVAAGDRLAIEALMADFIPSFVPTETLDTK